MNPAAPSLSASQLDWITAGLLAVCISWTALCLGGYRPETILVPSMVLAGLVAGQLLARCLGWRTVAFDPAGWWPLPFLVYAAFNAAFVSPVAWLGWADWSGWAIFAAMYWLAVNALGARGPRRVVHGAIALSAVASVGLACYQRWCDADWLMLGRTQTIYFAGRASGAFGIPNSQAALMVLLLPPAMSFVADRALRPLRRVAAGILAGVLLFGLALTISRGAWLSLALALTAWPLIISGRNWRTRTALAAGVLGLGIGIGATLYTFVPAVKARFIALIVDRGETTRPIMWKGAWALFREAPLTGSGAGSYNILFERHRPAGFRDEPQWAHNDYLNTLSDHGLVGVGLLGGGFLAACVAALRAGRLQRRRIRAAVIGVLAFGLSLAVDFHLKIPALAMVLAVALAECFRRSERDSVPSQVGAWRRTAAGASAAVVAAGAALIVGPHYRAESERYGARREIDWLADMAPDSPQAHRIVARGLEAFDRALAANPANAQAWSDRAYALALRAHEDPAATRLLGQQAEQAARQALACSAVVPEFWWRLGVALDMQGRWSDAGPAFAEALALAPNYAPAWYHQAYHFSLKPATHALARSAAGTCLQLDPGYHPAGELLRSLELGR